MNFDNFCIVEDETNKIYNDELIKEKIMSSSLISTKHSREIEKIIILNEESSRLSNTCSTASDDLKSSIKNEPTKIEILEFSSESIPLKVEDINDEENDSPNNKNDTECASGIVHDKKRLTKKRKIIQLDLPEDNKKKKVEILFSKKLILPNSSRVSLTPPFSPISSKSNTSKLFRANSSIPISPFNHIKNFGISFSTDLARSTSLPNIQNEKVKNLSIKIPSNSLLLSPHTCPLSIGTPPREKTSKLYEKIKFFS